MEARVLRNLVEVVELIVNVQRLLDVTSQCHFDLRWGFEWSNYNALLVFVIPFNVALGFCDIVSVIHVNLIIRLVFNSMGMATTRYRTPKIENRMIRFCGFHEGRMALSRCCKNSIH